jgi:hypothetical protein
VPERGNGSAARHESQRPDVALWMAAGSADEQRGTAPHREVGRKPSIQGEGEPAPRGSAPHQAFPVGRARPSDRRTQLLAVEAANLSAIPQYTAALTSGLRCFA